MESYSFERPAVQRRDIDFVVHYLGTFFPSESKAIYIAEYEGTDNLVRVPVVGVRAQPNQVWTNLSHTAREFEWRRIV